jgi:hypothetical protein
MNCKLNPKLLILSAICLLLLITSVPACNKVPAPFREKDQITIYSATIRRFLTVEYISHNFTNIYILKTPDDRPSDYKLYENKNYIVSNPLSGEVQTSLLEALTGLKPKFTWVDNRDQVPMLNEKIAENGAILTIGNINLQPDGSLQVMVDLYFGDLGSYGLIYILKNVDGSWQIQGDTGPRWMA